MSNPKNMKHKITFTKDDSYIFDSLGFSMLMLYSEINVQFKLQGKYVKVLQSFTLEYESESKITL